MITTATAIGHDSHRHDHDHHEQQTSRMSAMATSIMMITTTTMERKASDERGISDTPAAMGRHHLKSRT